MTTSMGSPLRTPALALSTGAYRFLLRMLPRDMRRAYGDSMIQTFRDIYRAKYRTEGSLALIGVWRRAITQVVAAAIGERTVPGSGGVPSNPGRRKGTSGRQVVDNLWQDLRFAVRSFSSKPVFTVTTLGIVGLGIGATTTIFSVVDGVLLRDLPHPNPNALVYFDEGSHTVPDYMAWREQARSFSALAAQWPVQMDMLGEGPPTRVNVGQVTPNFFPTLGGTPRHGRLFTEADGLGPAPVIALSYAFWMRQFGGDESMMGRAIQLDGRAYEVVGVVDRDFTSPRRVTRRTVDIWRPFDPTLAELQVPTRYSLSIVGRLNDGALLETAQSEVDGALAILDTTYPGQYRNSAGSLRRVPLVRLHEAEVGRVREPLLMLLGAVGLMLLIACANVANLFLARGADRERELALRAALGASRGRLASQLLTESVLLSVLGGLAGVALAFGGIRLLIAFGPDNIPRLDMVAVNYRILAFAVVVSVITGVVFGSIPAFYGARTEVGSALKEATARASTGRGHGRLKSALVVTEIALALVLLVGAGLLFNSFVRLTRVDPAFTSENVLAVPLSVESVYEQPEQRLQFAHALLDGVRGVTGVQSASLGLIVPFSSRGRCCWMQRARTTNDSDSALAVLHPVTPGYFETLGMRLLEGRVIEPADADAEPVPAVITRSMAQRFFPDGTALGNTLVMGRKRISYQVIGVVDDPKFWSLSDDTDYDVFLPFDPYAAEFSFFTLAVRAVGHSQSLGEQLRQAVWALNANMPVPEVMLLSTRVRESLSGPRFMSGILLAFAVFAIVLAAGGIYGTMLYNVSQRSHELGIRLALGASTGQLLRHVLRAGALLTGIGITMGLIGAYVVSRVLASLVFGITPQDVPTYLAVTVLLGSVALIACYLPARRAARLDPIATLRVE